MSRGSLLHDRLLAVSELLKIIGIVCIGVYASYAFWAGPQLHVSRPKILIFYKDSLPNGIAIPGISLDLSIYNEADTEYGAIVDAVLVNYELGERKGKFRWNNIHKAEIVSRTKSFEMETLSLPRAIHVPGNNLEVNQIAITDPNCPSNDIVECQKPDYPFRRFITEFINHKELLIEIVLETTPKTDTRYECVVKFSEDDVAQLGGFEWIVKSCSPVDDVKDLSNV